MELPQNARVAIVDNVYGEVEGLMEALASKGVPVVYYQGQKKFPKPPLSGIRLLFLDLELDGLEGQSDKAKTATAAANAATLIAPGNGPVVIVLWTKHCGKGVVDQFRSYLKGHMTNPYFVVCMDKASCQDKAGKFSTSRIKRNLSLKLAGANIIGLHTTWENALFKGLVKLSERVAAIASADEDWQIVISRMFYKLYKANSEKVELKTLKEQFLSACSLYGAGLLNAINFELSRSSLSCGKRFVLKKEKLAGDREAKLNGMLNAFLYYDKDRADPNVPGTVYAVRSGGADIKCGIAADFFVEKSAQKVIRGKVAKDVRLCKIVVTPSCDCAQKKEFRSGSGKKVKTYDRVVWALMVNRSMGAEYIERKYRKARCYLLEGFAYDGGIYDLLIDLDTLGFEVLDLKKQSRLFTLTSMVLADVQSKLANQLNRMGIVSV